MFKSARQNRLIIIILWIIAIFIAIIKLPSVTSLITNLNDQVKAPSQISKSEQLINANRLQHHWGRRLDHTSTADVVYNRRRGKITPHQQTLINHRVSHLQKHANEYGIQKITDLNSDRNGADELKSKDGSTEIVQLSVNSNYQGNEANVWADEIKSLAKVPSLRSAITSPAILKADSTHATIHMTITITIVGLLLASLAIGLIFKSLITPVISLITLLITDLITLSLTSNLAQWTGFNEYSPLAILLTILITGTIMTYFIYQAVIPELKNHRDANNAVQVGLRRVKRPLSLSGIILALAFGAAVIVPEANVRPITSIGLTFAVLTLAELTLIPTFVSWLGNGILWPSHSYVQPTGHRLWNRLARLSLWQPLIGIIAVIYFIAPFAYSYHDNLEYGQNNNVTTHNLAYLGSNWLNAHFTSGKSDPVTVYIKNPQKFNHEKTLKPVDDLTTKLQSMPGVNSVYSVTQPSSMPIGKYYVNHQLNTVDDSLNVNQNRLNKAEQKLKRGNKKLGRHNLNQISKHLDQINKVKGQIPKTDLGSQLKAASAGKRSRIANQLNSYGNQLSILNSKLGQLSGSLDNVNQLSNDTKNYQNQIKAVRKKLSATTNQIKKVNKRLNAIYSYLSSLQRSSASHQYFITPDQIQDTDFQQSLINFTSQNERTTKLQVIFNQAPSTRYNQTRINHLKSEIKTQLQGTPLNHAKVTLSGTPVQQATIQKNFKSGIITTFLISFGIILLGLILISRSLLNPIFWLLSFAISSLAGLQITELIVHFTTNQAQFNWEIMPGTVAVLAGIGVIELVSISLSYRHHQVDLTEWLHESLTNFGQVISAIFIITFLASVSLFTGLTYQTAQISLIIIITTVIFNWVLPLLASALGKYLKILPHSRL